jgi:hypothetical protein
MQSHFLRRHNWLLLVTLIPCCMLRASAGTGYFGVSQISINPQTPIRLAGYAGRTGEATQIQQTITAQAAAFGMGDRTSLMITVDTCGMPTDFVDSMASAISASHGIPLERINITSTHSHSTPAVVGYAPNLFVPTPLEAQHQSQYTQLLFNRILQVADNALANRTPGNTLSWGIGSANFGENRRGQAIAPDDHDLPVLRVTDANGGTKAVITNYATHATTLDAGDNKVSGDWPGYTREAIQELFPGSVALVMIGAGADSDPEPRQGLDSVDYARDHGQSVADEIQRLVSSSTMRRVSFEISAVHSEVDLEFATQRLPGDPLSARLAPSPGSTSYGITSWTFGDDLAMTFFEGELVADYSLRLKSAHDDSRLWVNAFSNGVQGYIPSERILYEGAYEADDASFFYDLPGRFAHGIEGKIINAVEAQLEPFYNPTDRLNLVVNVASGAVFLTNPTGVQIAFDAYTIAADGDRFNPSNATWRGLHDQNIGGWDEAGTISSSRLTEFNSLNATVVQAGAALPLGSPFLASEPTAFGESTATGSLEFEYSVPGGRTKRGTISYVGDRNNLVLTIDPLTGEAALQNQSQYFDVEIDAYTVVSSEGRLLPDSTNWLSLEDQGLLGWEESANSSSSRVTEFNPTAELYLGSEGSILDLGTLVDVTGGAISAEDFEFQFSTADGQIMDGIVVIGSLPNALLAGDFDADGDVDGRDFLIWQRGYGQLAVPAGTGTDGNGDGIVDGNDLAIWQTNYDGRLSTSSVPEPTASVLVALSLVIGSICRFCIFKGSGE